jgi:DNA-binding XRE family transcriptional regulator
VRAEKRAIKSDKLMMLFSETETAKQNQAKYQKLTAKLRSARQEAGLTQVEAGKLLKKPQAYVSKIERGERRVDAVELAELAEVYGKSMDFFIK